MEQADLIWHNGELVAWEDAKVHVLTHGLHYGTGVFEGDARVRDASRDRRSSATTTTSSGCSSRPSCTTCRSRTRCEELRTATHELIAANELRECYIRPIAFRGYGQMGLNPLDAPGRGRRSPCGRGAPTSARRASSSGVRAKISSWRRISHDCADPAREGLGPVPQQRAREDRGDEGRLRGGDPARPATGSCARAPARTSTSSATARSSRRRRPPASSTGSAASRSSRSPRDLGLRDRRARPRAGRAVPRRRGVPLRHRRRARRRCGRSTITRSASGEPGPITTRDPARVRRRAARPRSALRGVARHRPGADEGGVISVRSSSQGRWSERITEAVGGLR